MKVKGVPLGLALEALFAHVGAAQALSRHDFRELVPSETSRRSAPDEERRAIAAAVKGWAKRLPWKPLCFAQALAAHRLLAKRGHDAVFHYGTRRGENGIEAHVWVSSGGMPVVGHRNAHEFVELARFPET